MADPLKSQLKVSDASKEILAAIAVEVNAAYRDNFERMLQSLQDIAEGQKRLLSTLAVLIKAIEPKLEKDLSAAVAIAMPGERPDIATTLVLADPSAAGYTLTQGDLAKSVGLTHAEVSILTRAFRLDEDSAYALKIPHGKKNVVKFRATSAARLVELISAPPMPLSDRAARAVKTARAKLGAVATKNA